MLAEIDYELHKISILCNNRLSLDINDIDKIAYFLSSIVNDIVYRDNTISRVEAFNLLISILRCRTNNYISSNAHNYSNEHANLVLAWDRADKGGKGMYEQKINRYNSIPKVTKKAQLLDEPNIARWYKNLARSSKNNAETSLRRLSLFCEQHNLKPIQLIELANKDAREFKHMIIDHLNWMDEKGYAKGYQESILKAIKSWLRFNDISIDIPFKHGDTRLAKIQKLPDEDEYTDIINRADLRARVIIALISKSGVRPQVIGNVDGTDGLRIKDIPDIVIINGKAICKQYPCMIRVRNELSKNGKPYITFLSKQGVKYLLAYLNDRIKDREVLNDDSAIITWDNKHRYGYPKHRKTRLLNTRGISRLVREAIKGYNIRPYDLRHWFATQLEIAVAKGKISNSVKEALMGHISGIEHHYTYAKYNLAEPLIDELRNAYARAEEFLDIEVSNKDREEEEIKNKAHSIIEQLGKEELLNLLANVSRSNNSSK